MQTLQTLEITRRQGELEGLCTATEIVHRHAAAAMQREDWSGSAALLKIAEELLALVKAGNSNARL